MCIFSNVSCDSWTGRILYSDIERNSMDWGDEDTSRSYAKDNHFLNCVAYIPVIGSLAGVARIALAVVHIFLHFLAAFFTCNCDHLAHVIKGVAELLRGVIETIPIIGNIFACCYDQPFAEDYWSFFLVQIELAPKKPVGSLSSSY